MPADTRFLKREEVDTLRALGREISVSEDGQRMTIWHSRNHGRIYCWNTVMDEWQYATTSFRTHAPREDSK